MHQLVVSPFLDQYFVLCPGSSRGVRIPTGGYEELEQGATRGLMCPRWFTDVTYEAFGIDLAGKPLAGSVVVRRRSAWGFARAS